MKYFPQILRFLKVSSAVQFSLAGIAFIPAKISLHSQTMKRIISLHFQNYEHFYVIDFGFEAVICITERYFEIMLAKITKINSLISINNHLHSHT